ncbi:response regulator transcription factor [Burkholderia gladioli]|uniref:response regulator transcription factor n=1 Tax=Burkholderia gladioli TaxID=28095 RepID=UPI0020301D67|nr:response regulator [Burkholderia gladioli]URV28221.1 response regulator [Burkholderia gladioli]
MSVDANQLVSIVDDDPFVRAATSSLVRSFGWNARVFATADEFLASDTLAATGCLVCDVQMPGTDGIELLSLLEARGILIPTVFITAFASGRTLERASASRALCVIDKPIDASELESWIGRALGLWPGPPAT